jgi:hypothetical protein
MDHKYCLRMLSRFIWLRTYQYFRQGISSRTVLSKRDAISMVKQLQPFTLTVTTIYRSTRCHIINITVKTSNIARNFLVVQEGRPVLLITGLYYVHVHNRTAQTTTFLSRSFAYCYCTVGTFPMRSGPRSDNNATHSVCHQLSLPFKLLSHTLFLVHNTAPRASLALSNRIPTHGHFKSCMERPSTRCVRRHI